MVSSVSTDGVGITFFGADRIAGVFVGFGAVDGTEAAFVGLGTTDGMEAAFVGGFAFGAALAFAFTACFAPEAAVEPLAFFDAFSDSIVVIAAFGFGFCCVFGLCLLAVDSGSGIRSSMWGGSVRGDER